MCLVSDATTTRHDLGALAWSTNDMVVRDDRIHVDLYSFTDAGMVGSIGLVTPSGDGRIVATDLAMPNGMAITPDGSTLVVSRPTASASWPSPSANLDLLVLRFHLETGARRGC